MKVVITAYRAALTDGNGNILGMSGPPISSQIMTAVGSAAALPDECRYVRISTLLTIHVKVDGTGCTTADPQMFATSVEYFGAYESAVISIIAG